MIADARTGVAHGLQVDRDLPLVLLQVFHIGAAVEPAYGAGRKLQGDGPRSEGRGAVCVTFGVGAHDFGIGV